MDARKAAAGTVFLMTLSLSFGVLTASNCLPVIHMYTITVTASVSQPPPRAACFINFFDSVWTIGSDLCDPSGFVSYESCSNGTTQCSVNSSDFLKRGPTYVCCAPNECTEFIIAPVVNRITFPPVVQAGKEETIYATIAVKPLPANLPSLNVTLMHSDGSSTVDAISNWTTPSPSNSSEYIILHTFTVPLEVDSMTSVLPRIVLPNDQVWRNIENSRLAIGVIGIIFPELPTTTTTDASTPTTTDIPIATTISSTATDQAATTPTPTTTDTGTAATTNPTTTYLGPATTTPSPMATESDGTQPTSEVSTPTGDGLSRGGPTCIAPDQVAAAVVVAIVVPAIIFTVLVCVFFWYSKKKRAPEKNKEETNTSKTNPHHQHNGFIRNTTARASLSLPVHPSTSTVVTQNSTATPTPAYGETPLVIDESVGLLGPSSRNHTATISSPITGATNPGYNRIPSRDSNSPTTPYTPNETARPLLARNSSYEPSAASAASTGVRIEAPSTITESDRDVSMSSEQRIHNQHEATADELTQSHDHIYDTVRQPLPEIPEQNAHPVAYSVHQLRNKEHLHNIIPKNKEISSEQVIIHALVQQIQNQKIPLMSHPGPITDDSIPVYTRSRDGDEMDLPSQSGPVSIEVTSAV